MFAPPIKRPRQAVPAQAGQRATTVRPAGDSHERAAERAADRALAGPASAQAGAWPVGGGPGHLRAALGSGGQPLPPPTRGYFEARLGRDLGGVRVHTDALAGASARAVHAAAYTLGSDIAFAPGRWEPESGAGRRLLAHELAHVAQQSGGAPALGLGAIPVGVQRAVETLGGTWDTDRYELVNDGTQDIGVEIDRLRFKPNQYVDAKKIGLTQSVNSIDDGSVVALTRTVRKRSIPSGEPDEGLHIDRMSERSNPIYGMDDPTGADLSLGASTAASNAQWGWQYEDPPGTTMSRDATLYDGPTLPGHGPNSSQIFETTALAVEGAQTGTFYGSVRWGWRSDAANAVTIEPLALVSVGVPTASFRIASDLWNTNKTAGGGATQALPIAAGTAGATLPRAMTTEAIRTRLEAIEAEKLLALGHNLVTGVTGGTQLTLETLDFEAAALRRELQIREMGDFPVPAPDAPQFA